MDVGMEEQALVPCVKDHGESVGAGSQPARMGKGGLQGLRGGLKQDAIHLLAERGEKESAKLLGQSERDHEVRRTDAFGQLTPDPIRRVRFAALRAGTVVAGMKGVVRGAARCAGMDMPAHCRSATMGERPDCTAPRPVHHGMFPQEVGQKTAQRPDHGGCHGHGMSRGLPWQSGGEFFDERAAVLIAAMGHMKIDHRGGDLLVPKEGLHGVQTGSRLDQVGREGMAQGMHRGIGNAQSLAGHNHQALKRANGHRREGIPHAQGQPLGITGTPACIGSRATGRWARQAARSAGAQPRPSGSEEAKQEQRVTMKLPVVAQVFDHLGSQRNHPVLCPLSSAHQQLALFAEDVVDGQTQALISQPALGWETLRAACGSLSHGFPKPFGSETRSPAQ